MPPAYYFWKFADLLTELCIREKAANIMPDTDIDIFMKVRKLLSVTDSYFRKVKIIRLKFCFYRPFSASPVLFPSTVHHVNLWFTWFFIHPLSPLLSQKIPISDGMWWVLGECVKKKNYFLIF